MLWIKNLASGSFLVLGTHILHFHKKTLQYSTFLGSLQGRYRAAKQTIGGEEQPIPQQAEIPVVVVTERGARKRKSDPDSWRQNIRKNSRARGQEYVDTKGRQRAARAPQQSNCQTCRCKCNDNFSEVERSVICSEYWLLRNDSRQKDFLLSRVKIYGIQRERPRTELKRQVKRRTVVYSFSKNGKDERVCKKFFLKTLNIGHGPLDSAIESQGHTGTFVGEDKRGKHTPVNKISNEHIARVKRHIESFPKNESHYTRSDTRRLHLNQRLSISKMYRLYKEECERADPPVTPVKEGQYRKTFCNDYNLSFFHPKKDQWAKCTKFRMLSGVEKEQFQEEYDAHITRKGEAQEAKSADKRRAITDQNFVSATFDLQSVLQLPVTEASQMYYSRKLCVYNLCVYNAAPPNNATCYCWSEVEGGRGSNEIGTFLFNRLFQLSLQSKKCHCFLTRAGDRIETKTLLRCSCTLCR